MDADYWYRNLREPVRFYDRVVELLAAGEHTFVELSPHPVLAPAITDTLAQAAGRTQSAVIPTLHRDRPDQDSLATALAQLHNHGHSPSWPALYPHARTVGLPTYPFEHRRYWLAPGPTGDAGGLGLDRADHPLLGAVAALADQDQVMISGRLSPSTQGWLGGHQVNDTVVFPATGFIEVILRAGELSGCPVIDELILHTALTLSEQAPTDLQILVHPLDQDGRRPFSVHSRTGGQHAAAWTLHASGELSADQPAASPPPDAGAGCRRRVDQDDFYERLAQRGYRYGGLFRSLRGIGTDPARPEVVYAEVALPAGTDVDRLRYPPRPAGRRPAPVGLRAGPHRRGRLRVAAASVRVQRDHPVCHRGHPAACPTDPHRRGHVQAARHRPHRRTGDHHQRVDFARCLRPDRPADPVSRGYPTACSS